MPALNFPQFEHEEDPQTQVAKLRDFVSEVERMSAELLQSETSSVSLESLDDTDLTTPTDGDFLQFDGANWVNTPNIVIENGNSLIVQDSTDADSLTVSHDGADINFAFVGTTDLNVLDGIILKLWDSTDTDFVSLAHDGTNVILDTLNATQIQFQLEGTEKVRIGSSVTAIRGGDTLRVLDATNADQLNLSHDGTDGLIGTNAGEVVLDGKLRTAAAASGGAEANNTSTGVGWERVLTESDKVTYIETHKTANETTNTDVTLSDDNTLAGMALEAGEWYEFHVSMSARQDSGGSNTGIRLKLDFSNTPNVVAQGLLVVGDSTPPAPQDPEYVIISSEEIVTIGGSANRVWITISGSFQANVTTGGDVSLQWAQETSDANDLRVYLGSHVRLRKIP